MNKQCVLNADNVKDLEIRIKSEKQNGKPTHKRPLCTTTM